MTRGFKCLVGLAAVLLAWGCRDNDGQGNSTGPNSEEQLAQLPAFHSVDVEGDFEVQLLTDSQAAVEVRDSELIRPFYRFWVKDHCLFIRRDEKALNDAIARRSPLIDPREGSRRGSFNHGVVVTHPALAAIRVGPQATIDADLKQRSLVVSSERGSIAMAGNVDWLTARVVGEGYILGYDLQCEHLDLDLSGTGTVVVHSAEPPRVIRVGPGRWWPTLAELDEALRKSAGKGE